MSWSYNSLTEAGWIDTIWTPAEWEMWDGKSTSPIFELPWLTCVNVFLDYMHCKFLGSDQYIFGSLFYLICFVVMKDLGSPKQNLLTVWKWIKEYYQENKIRNKYRSIRKLSMFVRKRDYPKLRGKAAEIKGFGPVAVHLWKKVMSPKDKVHRRVKILLETNLELDRLLDAYPTTAGHWSLPKDVAKTFKQHMFTVGQLHKQLSDHFKAIDIKIFNMTAKSHMLMHIALLSEHVHPTLGWCFQSEGFMRVVQRLLQSCVRGNTAVQAMGKATIHYNLGKLLQYKKA